MRSIIAAGATAGILPLIVSSVAADITCTTTNEGQATLTLAGETGKYSFISSFSGECERR